MSYTVQLENNELDKWDYSPSFILNINIRHLSSGPLKAATLKWTW